MNIRFVTSFLLLVACVTDVKGDGFSVHAGLNYARVETVALGGHNLVLPSPPTLRDSFSGPSLRVGISYGFSDRIRVELGSTRFTTVDKYNAHFVDFVCPGVCDGDEGSIIDNVEQTGHSNWVAFVATREYKSVNLFGKLGFARTTIQSVQVGDRTNRIKEENTEIVFGLGLRYPFSDRFALRLDLDRIGSSAVQSGVGIEFWF